MARYPDRLRSIRDDETDPTASKAIDQTHSKAEVSTRSREAAVVANEHKPHPQADRSDGRNVQISAVTFLGFPYPIRIPEFFLQE